MIHRSPVDMRVFLILLPDIRRSVLFGNSTIESLCKKGMKFNFQKSIPLEIGASIISILTGCNPGNVGLPDITKSPVSLTLDKNLEKAIPSLLRDRGLSVENLVNGIPGGNNDYSFVYLDDAQWIGKILNHIPTGSSQVFIIAPLFHEYVSKSVNINSFLKDHEIIETDEHGGIKWENSLAFHRGNGYIWINTIGREEKGSVSPGEEYEEVRQALVHGIAGKLVDHENGNRVVEKIYKKEELFFGDQMSRLPDLVVQLRDGYGFSPLEMECLSEGSDVTEEQCLAYSPGGGLAIGQNIADDQVSPDLSLTSIAPSILYCFGQPIPRWMDGRVAEHLFRSEFIMNVPPQYENGTEAGTLSNEDETMIKERLKGLGYL